MSGRVDDVERLLQVLSVLQAAEGFPISRDTLAAKVPAYARSGITKDGIDKMMENDRKAMASLGIRIDNVVDLGATAAFVLREDTWRLPVELEPAERSLLVWAMATAGAATGDDLTSPPEDLSSLLGSMPRALDIAQTALAAGRTLTLIKDGEEVVFNPGMLAARHGRWFLLGTYGDSRSVKAPYLDRLDIVGLGGPLTVPVDIGDPDVILDQTAWPTHEQREAVVCCSQADLGAVSSWFPRAEVNSDGETAGLRFWYRNEESLVSKVIGLAGIAWIAEPPSAVAALREQVEAVLQP